MRRPILILIALAAIAFGARYAARTVMGRQSDGSFIVATGQRVQAGTIAFDGRPMDIALHPRGELLAILNQKSVLLITRDGVVPGSSAPLPAGASFRGCVW